MRSLYNPVGRSTVLRVALTESGRCRKKCCGSWKKALHPMKRSGKMRTYNPVWQTARLKGETYVKAV